MWQAQVVMSQHKRVGVGVGHCVLNARGGGGVLPQVECYY